MGSAATLPDEPLSHGVSLPNAESHRTAVRANPASVPFPSKAADRIGRLLGLAAAAIAGAALVGWLADTPVLRRVHPAFPQMVPATAFALILTGFGVASWGKSRTSRRASGGLAVVVIVLAATAAGLQVAGMRPQAGWWSLARPAPQAVVGLLLAGWGILAATNRRPGPSGLLALGVGAIGYLALLELIHGIRPFERLTTAGVALTTAICLILLAAGLVCRTANAGIGRVVFDPKSVGMIVRGGVAVLAAIPALSAVALVAEAAGVLSGVSGRAVVAAGTAAAVTLAIGWSAVRVSRRDRESDETAADRARVRMILDALPGHIALLGPAGEVLAANLAWVEFTAANRFPCGRYNLRRNFLTVCEMATDACTGCARASATGIRDVLTGADPRYVFDYPCPAGGQSRYYRMTVSPVRDGPIRGAVILIQNVTEQAVATRALFENEERLRRTLEDRDRALARLQLFLDRMPVACVVTDPELRVEEWNTAAERTFGFVKAEALGRTWDELIVPPEAREVVSGRVRRLTAGEPSAVGLNPNVTKDRRTIVCEWHNTPLTDANGRMVGFLAMALDVTAREAARAEATRSQEFLTEVARVARVGGWELDLATGIPSWSDEVRRLHDLPDDGRAISMEQGLDFYPEPGRTQLAELLRLAAETGRPFDLETPFVSAAGKRLWVRVSGRAELRPDGRPGRLFGSFQDISSMREAQNALLASEERFRALVEKSADGIALLDAQGRFVYLSPSIRDMLGYRPNDLLGRPAADYLHPDDREQAESCISAVLRAGGRPVPCRFRYRHVDGTYRVLSGVKCDRRDDPAVGAIVANFQDVTVREDLEEQLRQAQKLDAIGRLAGGVAHDFNNLLTVILGFGDMALSGLSSTDPARDWVNEMMRAGRRAADLTRQLLAFGRKQITDPKVLDLGAVVRSMERMLRRVISEDVELRIETPDGLWPVRADRGQIEQVLMNLAVNARDAMPSGGNLTVRVENLPADRLPPGTPTEIGDAVALVVSDTGCGMDKETRTRAFEPFFTTKDPERGTGLGLATVYGIVRQASGFIVIESESGRGATFRVYLPRCEEKPAAADSGEFVTVGLRGRETILLVEDDDSVRNLARYSLQRKGYRVIEAENGQRALDLLAESTVDVRLLVTDVVMPGMSGREVAERVLRLRPDIRVLYLSGYPQDHIGEGGILDEGTAFLQKPFLPDALAGKVREVLDSPR